MTAKKNVLANMIISLIIGVILGTLIIVLANLNFLTPSFILTVALIIIGIVTIISNVPAFVTGIMNLKTAQGIIDFIFAVLGIVFGLMMIFMQNEVVTVILAAYLIIFPIVRIVLSRGGWKDQIKKEWVKIIVGALLLAFLPAVISAADAMFQTVLLIAGWVVIALSVIFFVLSLVAYIAAVKKAAKMDPIETTAEDITDKQ